MTALAVLGLEVRSNQVRQAKGDLDKLSTSARAAAGSSDALASASNRVETGARGAAAATQAQAAATRALRVSSNMLAFRQRQLAVQSLDVAQSLALGMPPMMVAIQQGGQIAGIYAGQGGVAGAFKEAAGAVGRFARAHPVAIAATIALGAATFGLRNEINAASDVTVGFGDIFMATMQELAAGAMSVAGPAISSLGTLFATVSNGILDGIKLVGNSIINTFEFAIKSVVAMWNGLPAAFSDLGVRAAQGLIDKIVNMAREAVSIYNGMMASLGLHDMQAGSPHSVVPGYTIPNANEGAAASLMGGLSESYADTFSNDRVGDFLDRVSERAVTLARSADDAADAVGRAGREAANASAPMDLLGNSMQAANDNMASWEQTFTGFFSDFNSQLQQGASAWDAFKSAGMDALKNLASALLNSSLSNLFQAMPGMGGGGGGGFFSGLMGSFGGMFANGGNLGAGQWGIAGESGGMQHAEVIHGPAGITPVRNLMAANSNSNVGVSVIRLELSGDLDARIQSQAADVSVQVVKAIGPGIAVDAVKENRYSGAA